MKNKLKGINSRRTKTECISDLETKQWKSLPWNRIEEKKMKRNGDSPRDL